MKIENYQFPVSGFLSLEKDSEIIVKKMLQNNNLKKLLYYPVPNCLQMKNLDQEQTLSLINENIKIIPKLTVSEDGIKNYVIISFDNFSPNKQNPQFRDNIINFDIICYIDCWNLGDFKLRPYKIAGEIDSMFNNTHLTGIGTLQFLGANSIILTDKFCGLNLMYAAIHGKEDKI